MKIKKETFEVTYDELAGILEDYLRDTGEVDIDDDVLEISIDFGYSTYSPDTDDPEDAFKVTFVLSERQLEFELTPKAEEYLEDSPEWVPGDKLK